MFYRLLKAYCRFTLRFYFGDWQIHGKENIPEGPVIFIPNHQNAFLDAVLVICSSNKNPWALTRADIFKSNLAKKILTQLKMIPIYRFRDGFTTLKNNQRLIDDCVKKLNSGQSVLIFSEGSHGKKLQLRPLQKGFARLSFMTRNDLNIPVIPVGIQYYFEGNYKSRVLINFGKPIYANIIKQSVNNDENRFTELLLKATKKSLESLMVHIDEPDYELKYTYLINNRQHNKNLLSQLENDQLLVSNYPKLLTKSATYSDRNFFSVLNTTFSKINLFIPCKLIRLIIGKSAKDPQFIPSLNYGLGSFLVPLYFLIAGLIIGLIFQNMIWGIIYIIVVSLSTRFRRN